MGGMYSLEENFVAVDFEMLLLLFSADGDFFIKLIKFILKYTTQY